MARGKKASASDDFASPAAHGASKKRKSEALLKDLLGVTQDDGPVRCARASRAAAGARLTPFALPSWQLYSTPGEPAPAARPKAGAATAGNLEDSLLRAATTAAAELAEEAQFEAPAAGAGVKLEGVRGSSTRPWRCRSSSRTICGRKSA